MKRRKLLKSEPCAVPARSSEKEVIAVSQIVEADGERALCIDLFYKGVLKGRYFADEAVFNSYVNGKWTTNRLENVARLCRGLDAHKGMYYYLCREYEWNSKKDKKRALDFLDAYCLESYEDAINGKKREKALKRKAERIQEEMDRIPCVPDEAEAWLEETIFPGHFLYIKKTGKRTDYSCTACGARSWRKKPWEHGEMTTCPKCGAAVKANSRQKETIRKEPVVLLQTVGESEWVERQFRAVCRWGKGKKRIELLEQCRAVIPRGETWGKVYYGTMYEADEFEQEFWDTNPADKRFLSSWLYPGNLKDVLPYGLQNSGIMEMASIKFNVNKYITTFRERRYMEYLAKAGLTNLAADIADKYGWYGDPDNINQHADNLKAALNLDGNRVNRMKRINGGLRTLEWLQYEQKTGVKISEGSLEYLQKKDVRSNDCEEILKELGSVNRMVNYMKKQKVTPGKLTITWRDYLRMAEGEGMDTKDDIVRLPKDLKKRHDQLVELINERADAKRLEEQAEKYNNLDAQIREHLPEAKRYFWEDETYMIIPAGTCEELMREGRKLHHCVGASEDYYMKQMAAGRSWILFLRKKEDLETPYYTIQISMSNDQILQYHSEFDRQPNKKIIDKVLDKFKKSIKRGRQQARIQVAAIA